MAWEGILKYIPPLPLPLRGSWPLMTFKNICVIKMKPCKINLLLEWSTTKLFSASQLCSIPIYKVLKIMQIHFPNFEKKTIEIAQNSTQITGIAFSELKAEKKQLVTEN